MTHTPDIFLAPPLGPAAGRRSAKPVLSLGGWPLRFKRRVFCLKIHDSRPGEAPRGDATTVPRPLWLLASPENLSEIAGRPHRRGQPLELLAGPERLETGWWDAAEPGAVGDVRRDYFVARSPAAEWLWVYRDGAGWHVQGVFA